MLADNFSDYGEAFASANESDSAMTYYRKAYNLTKKYSRFKVSAELLDDIAAVFQKLHQPDSAAKYALDAYRPSPKFYNVVIQIKCGGSRNFIEDL